MGYVFCGRTFDGKIFCGRTAGGQYTLSQYYVDTLTPGNPFRDWLVHILGNRVSNKDCHVKVFRYYPSSHTVCRYQFKGEHLNVMAKFFAEPTGALKKYNPYRAMMREYGNLEAAASVINVSKPLAVNKHFNCALVTEYVPGKPLLWYIKHEKHLYERLTDVAGMLYRLHTHTRGSYNKKKEFRNYHELLGHLRLDHRSRETFDRLLGEWWHNQRLDRKHGCMVHRDVHPSNYIFYKGKPYAIDFESSWFHANPVRDLGILSAELKNYFELNKGGDWRAEPYIGHFLREYCRDESEFSRVTEALPFYMSIGLLRSARLHRGEYRNYLIKEALKCLKSIR